MLFAWLKRRRRARAVANPFPESWLGYLRANVGLYPLLTDAEQSKLRDDLRVFIAAAGTSAASSASAWSPC